MQRAHVFATHGSLEYLMAVQLDGPMPRAVSEAAKEFSTNSEKMEMEDGYEAVAWLLVVNGYLEK